MQEQKNTEKLILTVSSVAGQLYLKALKNLPPDVVKAIDEALSLEDDCMPSQILKTIKKNLEVALETDRIVCQDTGTPIYVIRLGRNFPLWPYDVEAAIRKGLAEVTTTHSIRPNIVHVLRRNNSGTNVGTSIPVIHFEWSENDRLEILAVPKGSGSENQSFMKMLIPADGVEGIKRFVLESIVQAGGKPCPPIVVGIGLGGSFDSCGWLAKRAAIRPIGSRNPDGDVASLEAELLKSVNDLGIGPMGLGGNVTALAVHIEIADTHISQLPVAVNCQCWADRRAAAIISGVLLALAQCLKRVIKSLRVVRVR